MNNDKSSNVIEAYDGYSNLISVPDSKNPTQLDYYIAKKDPIVIVASNSVGLSLCAQIINDNVIRIIQWTITFLIIFP